MSTRIRLSSVARDCAVRLAELATALGFTRGEVLAYIMHVAARDGRGHLTPSAAARCAAEGGGRELAIRRARTLAMTPGASALASDIHAVLTELAARRDAA